MSVGTHVTFGDGKKADVYLPLSTQHDFDTLILPLAIKLKLDWIQLFQTGIDVPNENLAEVIAEFSSLQANLAGQKEMSAATLRNIMSRTEHTKQLLEEVSAYETAEIFIG